MKYKNTHIHSPRNPEGEAEKIVKRQTENRTFNIAFVFDSPLKIFSRKTSELFNVPVISIIPPEIGGKVPSSGEIERCLSSVEEPKPVLIIPPVFKRLFPKFTLNVQKEILSAVQTAISTKQTEKAFKRVWNKNAERNAEFLTGRKVFDIEVNGNAVIIASGPSLESVADEIKKNSSGLFKVVLPSALKFTEKCGIKPDAVVMTDASPFNVFYISNVKLENIFFIFSPFVHHQVLKKLLGRVKFVPTSESGFPIPHRFKNLKDISAGTSAVASLKFLIQSGVDKVIFAGQDLSFLIGKLHCRGNQVEEKLRLKSSRTTTLQTFMARRTLRSSRKLSKNRFVSPNLLVYQKELEQLAERTGKVLLLNPAIKLKDSTEVKELSELANGYKVKAKEWIF